MTSLHRGYGAVTTPLVADNQVTLASLDPGRDVLLALFKAAINAELGPIWADVALSTSFSGKLPVQDVLPQEPAEQIGQRKTDFPLLCVYRSRERVATEEYTFGRSVRRRVFMFDWVLGPVNVIESRRVADAFTFVEGLVDNIIRERGHQAHASTTHESGWTQPTYVLDQYFHDLEIDGSSTEPLPISEGGPKYEALRLRLLASELSTVSTAGKAAPYLGSQHTHGTGDGSGIVEDLNQADTDFPPTNPPPLD